MPRFIFAIGSKLGSVTFIGLPSEKQRFKSISHLITALERLRFDEEFAVRITSGFPDARVGGHFDADAHFKLSTDYIDCAIADLEFFRDLC
jgi:hypothetical protein